MIAKLGSNMGVCLVDFREASEASRDVVIDAAVAPQDGSGPCRSVIHQDGYLAPTSRKAHDQAMKRVGHALSSTRDGRATPRAARASGVRTLAKSEWCCSTRVQAIHGSYAS